MKGLLLAGGHGTRLQPMTSAISKQLLPVYDKPMIYYPLCTLMYAGIREIAVITTPRDKHQYQDLLGSGNQFGLQFTYLTQEKPAGIGQSLTLAAEFIAEESVALILGDNIFHGQFFGRNLKSYESIKGAQVFAYEVSNPSDFGVIEIDGEKAISIEEKPNNPKSNLAVTGLYFFDNRAKSFSLEAKPSHRGEFEITDILQRYMELGELKVSQMPRGTAWLDTGTPNSLHDASTFVKVLEERQGLMVACPEEVAWRMGYISKCELSKLADAYPSNSKYGEYLHKLGTTAKDASH